MPFDGHLFERPQVPGRVDPGRVLHPTYNRLWARAEAAAIIQPGSIQLYDHSRGNFATAPASTAAFRRILGPVSQHTSTDFANTFTFSRQVAGNNDVTFICLAEWSDTSGGRGWMDFGGGADGIRARMDSGAIFLQKYTMSTPTDVGSLAISANVPYFMAISYRHSDGLCNILTRRLDTLAVATNTANDASNWTANGGSLYMFSRRDSVGLKGYAAAGYAGHGPGVFLTMEELTRISLDPWGLWREAAAPATPFVAAATLRGSHPLMGVGF